MIDKKDKDGSIIHDPNYFKRLRRKELKKLKKKVLGGN